MFLQQLSDNPQYFFAVVITVVLSICIHELAHGITAVWFGDRTPIETEHMTLNPAVHMGLMSVIVLLLAGIAWGAMPVNPHRMRGRYSPAIVALAGPASNVLLAILALGALGLWQRFDSRLASEISMQQINIRYLLLVFGITNLNLAVFNMIPVPPLDGSRILETFSTGYARLMESLATSGGAPAMFLIVFLFAGKLIAPLTDKMADQILTITRGW